LDPSKSDSYYFRGEAYRYKNQLDLARADLEKTLQLNPEHEVAKSSLQAVKSLSSTV
ncbi:MAG: tetratricopeptide repeat protein, partial [Treponema sp.]|nr:tetratricopeptide repeat protein [Treponema sp.]